MGSIVYFFILLMILQFLSPLLYAYPLVGLLLWVGIIAWFIYRNKKQREAFYKAQQQQQQQDSAYSQTSQSRPHVDEKDVIDAEYTEHEIK